MGKTAAVILGLVLLPSIAVASGPTVSDEIVIDHGFRYAEPVPYAERVALAVQDSVIVLAFGTGPGESIVGYRRSRDGAEVDINRKTLGPNLSERRSGPFDVDDFDGVGWKVAYLTDYGQYSSIAHGLRVRNLDPVSMEPTQDDLVVVSQSPAVLSYPASATTGDLHVLVWAQVEGGVRSLKMMRFDRNLGPLDSGPREIATHLWYATIAIAMTPGRGMLLWIDDDLKVRTLALGPSGLPEGAPNVIASSDVAYRPMLAAIDRLGSGWLAAWEGPSHPVAARLDSLGNILAPGILVLPGSTPREGLAVAGSDSLALVAWRLDEWDGRIEAARIDSAGSVLDTSPIVVSSHAPYSGGAGLDPRNIDCATIDGRFVVLWDQLEPPPTFQTGRSRAALQQFGFPVLAQWIGPDGRIVFPEPVLVNQASEPYICAVQAFDDRYLLVERDGASEDVYLHKVVLDSTGTMIGQPVREITPVERGDGNYDHLTGLDASSWEGDGALLYGYTESYSSEWGDVNIDRQNLIIERQSSDGSLLRRVEIYVGQWTPDTPPPRLNGFDAAGMDNSVLIAYGAARGDISNSSVRVELIPSCGRLLHYWRLVSPGPDVTPAVAALENRFLVVWDTGPAADQVLQRAVLDPADLRSEVEGETLVPDFGTHGAPTLIRGPHQILCVFPAKLADDPLGYDIYGVRMDLEGATLDPAPIALCALPGDQGSVQGVWDGRNYLVVWSNADQGSGIFGNRVTENGAPLDGNGFAIAGGGNAPLSITSGGHGTSMIGYLGNRIRLIRDLGVAGEGGAPPDSSSLEGGGIATRGLWVGDPNPNPTRGAIQVDLAVPPAGPAEVVVMDVSGRRLFTRSIGAGAHGRTEVWDGRVPTGNPAPTGIYFLRVSTGGETAVRRVVVLR